MPMVGRIDEIAFGINRAIAPASSTIEDFGHGSCLLLCSKSADAGLSPLANHWKCLKRRSAVT